MSTDGIVLATNEAAERRMTKRSAIRDPVGDHLDRLLPADEAEQKKATIQQVASTATVVYRESEVRARSYECWYFPAFSPDRSIVAVAVYARDVSEQKETLAEVRKLSQAIEYSPSTVFITDSDGKIEYVNPKFTELTGYTSAEAVGQNPRMLKSGHTPPERYAELWNTILSGGVWRGELLNKKKNGELYWEFASIAPVMDGQTITNFVAVMEDITIAPRAGGAAPPGAEDGGGRATYRRYCARFQQSARHRHGQSAAAEEITSAITGRRRNISTMPSGRLSAAANSPAGCWRSPGNSRSNQRLSTLTTSSEAWVNCCAEHWAQPSMSRKSWLPIWGTRSLTPEDWNRPCSISP